MNNNYKPGEGRRKKFAFDKGRQLDSLSLKEVKEILPLNDIRRDHLIEYLHICLLYTSPSPRDRQKSRMPSSA